MSDFYFACRKSNLLAIDGGCKKFTYRAHVFLMRSCCTVVLSLTSRTDLTHHAWLKAQESRSTLFVSCTKTVTLHRAMSYVTPHLMTSSTGTPSSLVLNPSLSEHKPCGDLRPHLSGALAEPRPFTQTRSIMVVRSAALTSFCLTENIPANPVESGQACIV